MDSYESVLLVKQEVFVFKLPPRTSNRGYRAADWNLNEPQWSGRLRLVSKDTECRIVLEDRNSGELYAKCPIDTYPGLAIESVTDSSRYFVLRLQDDNGRTAFIGLGFGDRSDSFDLNVALQDHFKWLKKEEQIANEPTSSLDLRFKEGETIKINMKIAKKDGNDNHSKSQKNKLNTGNGGNTGSGLLPPPPSGKLPPPPGQSPLASPSHRPLQSAVAGTQSGEPTTTTATNSNWVQF